MRHSPQRVADTRRALRGMYFVDVDKSLFDAAGIIEPPLIRSLDAIRLAAAISLGDDLDEVIAYDERLRLAAQAHGLTVAAPR